MAFAGVTRWTLIAALVMPVAVRGQAIAPAGIGCAPSSMPSDTLALVLSLRVFRGRDSLPDPTLTRGIGDLIRSHFVAPASINQLLYPNTYRGPREKPLFLMTVGTFGISMQPDGSVQHPQWLARSMDSMTDAAIQTSVTGLSSAEMRDVAASANLRKAVDLRLQFLLLQDSTTYAPLLRMRVPMMRVDSESSGFNVVGGGPGNHIPTYLAESFSDSPPTIVEFVVGADGRIDYRTVEVVSARWYKDMRDYFLSRPESTYPQPFVGGCSVGLRRSLRFYGPR